MNERKDYIVGLDIGTNSTGWVVMNKNNDILKLRGKTAIGARLFEEGHSAADRREFRATRRRIKRTRRRIRLLEEFFDPYMAEIDPNFFARMHESILSPRDDRKTHSTILFPTKKQEKEFYKKYPTIYHLRAALINSDEKFDLREIYLAIHHIIRNRGNFLNETPTYDHNGKSNFTSTKLDLRGQIEKLNEFYQVIDEENKVLLNTDNIEKVEEIIRNRDIVKMDKQKQIINLLLDSNLKKDEKTYNKSIISQVVKAILGYKAKFANILESEELSDKGISLASATADSDITEILSSVDENRQSILNIVLEIYQAINLISIIEEGKTLSESMVDSYEKHKHDLMLLKTVISQLEEAGDTKAADELQSAYNHFVKNRYSSKKNLIRIDKDTFYKTVQKYLNDSDEAKEINSSIDKDNFMPKQRTNRNGAIPFQLHQVEMDIIIRKQEKYYPFLAEENPVKEHMNQAPYKLDELLQFRIPYYVGPLITADQQKASSGKSFAWMIRKDGMNGEITPWNFDQVVDRTATAERFIKRMTTKDTYLLGEDVLPKNSLLYQRFEVLNELSNIRLNNKKLTPSQKQELFEHLFMKHKNVNAKLVVEYFLAKNGIPVEVKGLSDGKKFLSSLSTYNQLKEANLLGAVVDDSSKREDIEKIITWSTIFEDSNIFQQKLKSIKWLNQDQIKNLSKIRYQGWGRLSEKLLTKIYNENGENLIGALWNDQLNFQQIISKPAFKEAIEKANNEYASSEEGDSLEDILSNAYTSPANKKAIRQVVKVVDDIVKANKGVAPAQIAIEFARDQGEKGLTVSRQRKLLKLYEDLAKELADDPHFENVHKELLETKQNINDRLYLYFSQLGRDAYSGKPINIDQIVSNYDIDHIMSQAFIKDDSLDNRVLVSRAENNEKSDQFAIDVYGNNDQVRTMWEDWFNKGLITKTKYNNLMTSSKDLSKYRRSGFIHRQLVETSQIIKLVAVILQAKYPNSEIIEVKAKYNHELREKFDLYKGSVGRSVNDYHHAIDAYLTAITANYLYQVYPKYRPFFVYGQYKKFTNDPDLLNGILNNAKSFNYLYQLTEGKNDEIHISHSQEVVFSRKDIIGKLKRAYGFKYMLVTQEVSRWDEALYNQTLYPNPDRDKKTRKGLIPRAKGMDPSIYGGYSGSKNTFLSLIKIQDPKGDKYKIVGVPMTAIGKLKKAKKAGHYLETLREILDSQVNTSKKKIDFKVLKAPIPYRQLVSDGESKFLLGSSTYKYNAKQLVLTTETMRIITGNFVEKDDRDKQLDQAYDEIIRKVDQYLPLFDMNGFRKKLREGKEKFSKLKIDEKQNAIVKILDGLHDNAVITNLKEIGFSTGLGMLQNSRGIQLSENAELIYQSPTGLYERRIKIKDL